MVEGGRRMARFRVAVDTGYKDDTGQWQERADWVNVVTFRDRLIERLETAHGLKGRMVFVDGRLRSRSYDKDGETRYMTEVEAGAFGDIALLG